MLIMELPFSELTLIQKYGINKRSPWQVNFPSNWKWSSEKEKKTRLKLFWKDKVFQSYRNRTNMLRKGFLEYPAKEN